MSPGAAVSAPRTSSSTSSGRSFIYRLWTLLVMSCYGLLTFWRACIGRINDTLLFLDSGLYRRSDFLHKVVLLGDGMTKGFGAWVSLGTLNGLVKWLQELTPMRQGIKTQWIFFERGRLNSTTADWLPSVGGNGLLDRVMGSRACRDVDVVVVMVGLQDVLAIKDVDTLVALADDHVLAERRLRALISLPRSKREKGEHEEEDEDEEEQEGKGREKEPEEGKDGQAGVGTITAGGGGAGTAAAAAGESDDDVAGLSIVGNLRRIVEHLAKERGVHVCLCTLPTVGAPTSVRAQAIVGLNRRIKAMAASLGLTKDQLTVVDLAQRRVSRPETRSLDGVHFTSQGYKAMAEAILDDMLDPMVRLEWKVLQDYVTGRKKRPARGVKGLVQGVFGGGSGGGGGGQQEKKGR